MTDEVTARVGGLLALRERKRLLDVIWLTLLAAVVLATFAPWFVRILDIDYGPVARLVLGFAVVYGAGSLAVDAAKSRRSLWLGLFGLEVLGMGFLGALWLAIGSVDVPVFLISFAVPVVASGVFLSRGRPFVAAGIAIAVVVTCALLADPALRWYLLRLGLPLDGLFRLLPSGPVGAMPVPDSPTPTTVVLTVGLFSVFMLLIAALSSHLSSFMGELYATIRQTRTAVSGAERLSQEVLRAVRLPSVLVHRDSGRVVAGSESFFAHLDLDERQLDERALPDLIDWGSPEILAGVLRGELERATLCTYRLAGETRVCRLVGYPIRHDEVEYVYVTLEDVSDLFYLESTLDALEDAYVIVGPDRRVRYANRIARRLMNELEVGADAAAALSVEGAPEGWWHPGPRLHRERTVVLTGAPHDASLASARLPGHPGAFIVLRLRPRAAA